MKKRSFKKELTEKMEGIGYFPFITDIKSELTFLKYLENKHYLIVGVRSSRYDKNQFMGSFYLSWLPIYAIVNFNSMESSFYSEIYSFLTKEENKELVTNLYYWEKTEENVIDKFIQAVQVSEPRFLSREEMYKELAEFEDLIEEYQIIKMIISFFHSKDVFPSLKFELPRGAVDLRWYQAAEKAFFLYRKRRYDINTIKHWGILAFNIDKYAKLYGMPTEEYLNR